MFMCFLFFKQKPGSEIRISDWSSDVCSSDLTEWRKLRAPDGERPGVVEPVKHYALQPGMVVVYNETALHSPLRTGPTRLIHIQGRNPDRSEERRGGKECDRKWRTRGARYNRKNNEIEKTVQLK